MAPRRPCLTSSVDAWLQSASRHQPLSERTVLELSRRIQRWQQHPDGPDHAPKPVRRSALRARDQLVQHNLRLVSHTWRRNRHLLPLRDEGTVDAMQEAALNLVRAAEKFDPAKGYRFSTYASFWLQRGFSEFLQRGRRMIRFPAEKAGLMLKAQRLIEQHQANTGSAPSLPWLAAQLRFNGKALKPSQLAELLQQWRGTLTDSLDQGVQEEESDRGFSLLVRASQQISREQGQQQEAEQSLAGLERWLSALEPLELRAIRNLYLRQPCLTPHQLRRSFPGMSPEEIQGLKQQALGKLRAAALKQDQ
jgi:RNA polymerase primary sigma factor